jgi:hypothetical protein
LELDSQRSSRSSFLAPDVLTQAALAGAFRRTLVLGGARAGKSRYAESLITALPPPWIYLATSEARDAEMAERISRHRAERGERWETIEVPHHLAQAVTKAPPTNPLLIDCLTLWLVAPGRSSLSPMRSAPASYPTTLLRGVFATCKVNSTRALLRGRTAWSFW